MEVNENMVSALITEDLHMLQRQLAEELDISKTSVRQIVRMLGMRRMSVGDNACTIFQIAVA